MDAVMIADPNSTAAFPAGVTSHQIDENSPTLAGFNRANCDPRWENIVSHSVCRPEVVVPAR